MVLCQFHREFHNNVYLLLISTKTIGLLKPCNQKHTKMCIYTRTVYLISTVIAYLDVFM